MLETASLSGILRPYPLRGAVGDYRSFRSFSGSLGTRTILVPNHAGWSDSASSPTHLPRDDQSQGGRQYERLKRCLNSPGLVLVLHVTSVRPVVARPCWKCHDVAVEGRGLFIRLALVAGALLIALPIGFLVTGSVLADAAMLVNAGGWWMLALYLVTPAAIGLYWLRGGGRRY